MTEQIVNDLRSLLDNDYYTDYALATIQLAANSIENLQAANAELLEALKAMIEDGWLLEGPDGPSDTQLKVLNAYNKATKVATFTKC